MEEDASETVAANVWEEESPTEELEIKKTSTDVTRKTSCEALESYLDEKQTEEAFAERKNTVWNVFNVESEEPSSENFSFEAKETQETKSRCRMGVLLFLGILFAAFGTETYFFVKVLHKRDNLGYEVKKLTVDNERLRKAYSDLEQRLTKTESDLEDRLTKGNSDWEQKLREANSDLNAIKSENEDWKKKVEEEESKKQIENQNKMEALTIRNEFLDCMKQLSQENEKIRNVALYFAVRAKSIDTIQYLLDLGADPTFETQTTIISGTILERSALKLAASESSDASLEMIMLLLQNKISSAYATETLNIYIKTNSPDARIVNRLIEKKALSIAAHEKNTFTMALRNASVGVPVYQELVRGAQAVHESIPKTLLSEAYFWKDMKKDSLYKSLDNLIEALEEGRDDNYKEKLKVLSPYLPKCCFLAA